MTNRTTTPPHVSAAMDRLQGAYDEMVPVASPMPARSDDLIKRLRDTAVIRAADIHEAADRIVALEAENNRRAGIIHDQDAHILALEAQVARLREADPSAPIDLSQEAVDDMAWTLDHMGEPGSRPRHAAAMLRALRAAAPADPEAEAARGLDMHKLAERLVTLYLKDAVKIADLCDETLDPSGALLGFVRDAARSIGEASQ